MDRLDKTVLTIGHSNHPTETFVTLLERHRVTAVADVRSAPYSRFNPHFNRDALAVALKARRIEYVYLGRELGGRPDDPACYEGGRIRYDRVARTDCFRDGLERVLRGMAKHRIALMCSEKEPLDCHRMLLVARALDDRGVDVAHVHANGELERHVDAMDRLIAKFNLPPDGGLFRQRAKLADEAVERQAKRAAFVNDDLAASHAAES